VPDPAASLTDARERAARRVAELTAALEAIVESSEMANLDDEHDPEGATVGFERAQVAALLDGARTQLNELDEARERLGRGAYGRCERCGEQIPDARLEARPATRVCIACAAP
jgi:DnaK suppressor protein